MIGVPKSIDSDRLWAILTPSGHASRVQNAIALCRTRFTSTRLEAIKTKDPRKASLLFWMASPRGFEPLLPP